MSRKVKPIPETYLRDLPEKYLRAIEDGKSFFGETAPFMGRIAVQHMAVDILSEEGSVTVARLAEEFQKQVDAAIERGEKLNGKNSSVAAALAHLMTFGPGRTPPSEDH